MLISDSSPLVSIKETIQWDHETAISLADRFRDNQDFFLLESAAGSLSMARFSYIGFESLWQFKFTAGVAQIAVGDAEPHTVDSSTKSPLNIMADHLQAFKLDDETDEILQMVGAYGFAGYEYAHSLEPSVGKRKPAHLGMPEILFFIPKNFLVLDRLMHKLHVVHSFFMPEEISFSDRMQLIAKHKDKVTALIGKLNQPHSLNKIAISQDPLDFENFNSSVSYDEFLKRVQHCKEQIIEGEIFQVQMSNRLSAPLKANPFSVFRHLRMLNPSPYMFYYKFGENHLIGASPEMMVNVEHNAMIHRPIAGTRKRAWDPEKDKLMKEELINSPKEQAEHIMLVDLSRNDVGRVCKPGSVVVDDLMIVEEYSHVFHLVSQVRGKLQKGVSSVDALEMSFPNGTVSGAPKVRAMQIINELEEFAREFYAGSLGVFTLGGGLKSTILIRTLFYDGKLAHTQAAAGIVYDSIPDHEWKETQNKMKSCLYVMQNTHS